jgi:hypothetical protein
MEKVWFRKLLMIILTPVLVPFWILWHGIKSTPEIIDELIFCWKDK